MQITAREGPFERFGGALVAGLEGHHVPLQIGQTLEVGGGEQLALNDREIHLDLIEPTGVNRGMNQDDVGPPGAEAVSGAPSTVAGAIVCNQEHAAGRAIRLLAHDLADQTMECRDAVLALTAAEQPGAMHVPRGEVGQRAGPRVFVLNIDRPPWCRGNDRCLRRLAWIRVFSSMQRT
jgi:hypothetical protein